MKNSLLLSFLLIVCITTHVISQNISIIPEPVKLTKGQGSFVLTSGTPIITTSADLQSAAKNFASKINVATGFSMQVATSGKNGIQLALNTKSDATLGEEGYLLDVSSDQITVKANTKAGIFYGLQTILQLLPPAVESTSKVTDAKWEIPAVNIVDYPRFAWRGIMLDVSRHYFDKAYIKKYLDQMAMYKLNIFHWHLTDDNGWRIEIKSYPKLTEIGSKRVARVGTFGSNDEPKPGEKATDGGFYTQEDIKEIVQYAKERNIEILPEIDVPGHSMAVLAAYPELCVTKDTSIRVNPGSKFSTWFGDGKFTMQIDNTLNPTDEKVYTFLDKVFGEVAQLFPFEYIHIGGDECYKGYWEKDAGVQAFMKKNNLKTGEELQSYFTKRLTRMIMAKKKKVIGWDEILEGGLAPGAAVMSWRGTKGGIEAAHQKHEVVMSPNPQYYLDMGQGEPSIEPPIYGIARLKDTYMHEVIPPGVDSTYILGGQGNLWTEQIPTTHQVEYMTYPRAYAMAESFWSPVSRKNWDTFVKKVETHFQRFDNAGINYATSLYDPIIKVKKTNGALTITLEPQVTDLAVYYTYDNTVPNKYSLKSNGEPITYPDGADSFRVISYRNGKPIGRLITLKTEELMKRAK
jgi:hexosaminidase